MLSVICVCKSGEHMNRNYTETWVIRLRDLVKKNLSINHQFICLTDLDMDVAGIITIPLKHNWIAWWSKIELFRRDIPGDRFLYLDLDSLPINNLDGLVNQEGSFIAINPNIANKGQRERKNRTWFLASGVMVWDEGYANIIYDLFKEENTKVFAGDQDWIGEVLSINDIPFSYFPKPSIKLLRDLNPSFDRLPEDCKVICCSPNGWRQDLVKEYKGKQYSWVEKLWKGKI